MWVVGDLCDLRSCSYVPVEKKYNPFESPQPICERRMEGKNHRNKVGVETAQWRDSVSRIYRVEVTWLSVCLTFKISGQ
jgi:hypothetical protein